MSTAFELMILVMTERRNLSLTPSIYVWGENSCSSIMMCNQIEGAIIIIREPQNGPD